MSIAAISTAGAADGGVWPEGSAATLPAGIAGRVIGADDLPPALAALLYDREERAHAPHSEHDPRCLTPILQELALHRDQLDPALLDRLELLWAGEEAASPRLELGRPWSIGSVASTTHPIAVHYRARLHEGRAREVLAMAERSWDAELAMGFYPAEPDDGRGGDDRLDIYLTSEVRSGGGAYTSLTYTDPDPTDGIQTSPVYIAVYEALDMEEEMPVFIAHELNHALQAAMDSAEQPFIWESTAVAIEDLVFDDVNDYYGFIDDFQERPHYSLNVTSGIYPYGAVVFTQFLDTFLGYGDGQLLAEIWQRTGQEDDVNEPDYLDAIDDLAQERGAGGIEDLYGVFAGWRFFAAAMDDGAHLEEAGAWRSDATVLLTAQLSLADLPAIGLAPAPGMGLEPQDLGANYYTIDTGGAGGTLDLLLTGQTSTRWALTAVRWYADGPGDVLPFGPAGPSAQLSARVPIDGADQIAIAVINLGEPHFDAEAEGQAAPYTLKVTGPQ